MPWTDPRSGAALALVCFYCALTAAPLPQVPVHHPFKKGYFVALRDAFLAWDEAGLADVKQKIRAHEGWPWANLSASAKSAKSAEVEAEIESKMYYNSKYFTDRVRRRVLPPEALYPRVRAVFAFYGQQIDPDSKKKKSLFDSTVSTRCLGYWSY